MSIISLRRRRVLRPGECTPFVVLERMPSDRSHISHLGRAASAISDQGSTRQSSFSNVRPLYRDIQFQEEDHPMPVYELRDGEVVPFRRVAAGPELYESTVEELLWRNLEEFTGVPLFPVRRQPQLATGGRPDVVALGPDGSVYVLEVKRDIDRSQLAQCLEYAGWALTTNLDELARLYSDGPDAFFRDWQAFTESSSPVVLSGRPKLVLVARDFHGRTASALEFLHTYNLPVQLLRVTVYEDGDGRRLVDVQRDSAESEVPAAPRPDGETRSLTSNPDQVASRRTKSNYAVALSDLVEAGVIDDGEPIEWTRPQLGTTYRATVSADGAVVLDDGRRFVSPSTAGATAAGTPTLNGWISWRVPRRGNKTLDELRADYLNTTRSEDSSDSA
jgi:hypothetical protein